MPHSATASEDEAGAARRHEVLDAALALLVERGQGLTMGAVAARASCSKETLYKWFGDREGLLSATVRRQASRVRVASLEGERIDREALEAALARFASDWLRVVSSPTSLALNRLAIGSAGAAGSEKGLGAAVLANGRFALAARLKPVLEAARAAGVVAFCDAEEAFRTFFGLVARDVQIRLLLGDGELRLGESEIAADARRATEQFLRLFGAQHDPADNGR